MALKRVLLVGAGAVGLATAYHLARKGVSVAVLEKEDGPAHHQTGRNSGVIHSGIYYKPGSLKARNCRRGKAALEEFCSAEGIAFDRCGKVIVATCAEEVPRLEQLYARGCTNGVECHRIGPERLAELEPHCRGVAAIHVTETGIVDYRQVAERLAQRITEAGGELIYGARVQAIMRETGGVVAVTSRGEFRGQLLVNCAGLQSDRVTELSGVKARARIVPFKGIYYQLEPAAWPLCQSLIYPVPDPAFPFLGVHFTRVIGGGVECGPNAVLAFGREAYGRWEVKPQDLLESLTYGGFLRLAGRHWRMGLGELVRTFFKPAFVAALQRLLPDIQSHHLVSAPSGIRAQALLPDGALVDDFVIQSQERVINVCNAPSPAATASLSIGWTIADSAMRLR